MAKTIHPYFIKSSNLILVTVGLGVINMFLSSQLMSDAKYIIIAVGSLLFVVLLAYLVRQGKNWIKYLLLVLTVGGILLDPNLQHYIVPDSIQEIINLAQSLLQIGATVLLFLAPKTTDNSAADEIIDADL